MNWLIVGKWVGGTILGLMLGWIVYAGLIRPTTKPNPTTRQEAETILNYYNQPRVSFGCARWEVKGEQKKDISSLDSVNTGSNPL